MPDTAFKKNAGTEVTTDILFFKKRSPGAEAAGEPFQNVEHVDTKEGGTASVNEYFAKHPEMVLGEHSMSGSMYRGGGMEYTLSANGKPIGPQLEEALGKLPEKAMTEFNPPKSATQAVVRETLPERGATKPNGLAIKNGKVFRRVGNEMVEQPTYPKTLKSASRICCSCGIPTGN